MLDLVDSILGFSAIMLGVGLLITVIVQGISGLLNMRGTALAGGLAELLVQAKFDEERSRELAKRILTHRLISDSVLPKHASLSRWVQASAIRKEELLRLLSQADELSVNLRSEKDKLENAANVVSLWFDSQMDRVSQAFSHHARIVTIVISFVTAFALHFDASTLLKRSFSDPEARAKLVASTQGLIERSERLGVPEAAGSTDRSLEVKDAVAEMKAIKKGLDESGIELLPKFESEPKPEQGIHAYGDYLPWRGEAAWQHFVGVAAAAALLSLGAPFWFNLLKSVANLRTMLANSEAKDREKE